MRINSKLKGLLQEHGISLSDGLSYLLTVYYNLEPSYIPDLLIKKVLITKIFERDGKGVVTWNYPLFDEQLTKFEWVKEYREAFKKINKERAGSLSTCVKRMKDFFAENPDVRLDEVQGAVKMYLRSIGDAQYLTSAHKFIYEGAGKSKDSKLEYWIELYRESQVPLADNRSGNRTTMQ